MYLLELTLCCILLLAFFASVNCARYNNRCGKHGKLTDCKKIQNNCRKTCTTVTNAEQCNTDPCPADDRNAPYKAICVCHEHHNYVWNKKLKKCVHDFTCPGYQKKGKKPPPGHSGDK